MQTDLTLPRLGPHRGGRQYPMASLLGSGAMLSMGSDWPVSSHRPQERLAPGAALAAYTTGVAHQAFEEADWRPVAGLTWSTWTSSPCVRRLDVGRCTGPGSLARRVAHLAEVPVPKIRGVTISSPPARSATVSLVDPLLL